MSQNNVTKLVQPVTFSDLLTDILRDGARTLLAQVIEAEVAAFTAKHVDLKTEGGLQRAVSEETGLCRAGRFRSVRS